MSAENVLGSYVREKRNEKGMSQRELANASGISNAEISRLESGKRKASSPAVLKAIAKALNVPVETLLEKAGIIEEGKQHVDKALEEIGDMPGIGRDRGYARVQCRSKFCSTKSLY